jgi:hypothetical protein
MASVTVDFVAKVAIGIEGYALLAIEESVSARSVYRGSDIDPALVLNDIKDSSIYEWVECNLGKLPKGPGIFTFCGTARFDEDTADYAVTCDGISQQF